MVQRLQADLRAYYERQTHKLLELARGCSDPVTATKLVAMATEYIDKLDLAPGERPVLEPEPMSH
jgi:hypothetical protein